MADLFKQGLNGLCGPGGLKCGCCSDAAGKNRAKQARRMRRLVRRLLRAELASQTTEG